MSHMNYKLWNGFLLTEDLALLPEKLTFLHWNDFLPADPG